MIADVPVPCKLNVARLYNVLAVGGQPYNPNTAYVNDDMDCVNYCIHDLTCIAAQTFDNSDGTTACIVHTQASDISHTHRVDGATLYIIERCNDTGELCLISV